MSEKRFVKGYCCGDTGLVDKGKEEWFVENINSVSDLERNWNDVLDKLNEVADENKKLKQLLQAIITKEFELSSDDNDYDPLTEFFNNEVNISQIEVEIDVEKND